MTPLSIANAILLCGVTSDVYALCNVLMYCNVDKAKSKMVESVVKM